MINWGFLQEAIKREPNRLAVIKSPFLRELISKLPAVVEEAAAAVFLVTLFTGGN